MVMSRDDFVTFLSDGFYGVAFNKPLYLFKAFLTNDKALGDTYRTNFLRADDKISTYLTAWDAAVGDAAKEAVEASVSLDLGSASVTPSDAVKWPVSGGLFGDVKSPGSSVVDGALVSYNGTSGQLINSATLENGIVVKNVAVDGKTVGNTLIFTTDAVKTFVPVSINVTITSVSGLSLVSTVSVGTNSPNYNNICAAALLTGLDSNKETLQLPLIGNLSAIAPSTAVYTRVSIGSTATTYDLNVAIAGFYI